MKFAPATLCANHIYNIPLLSATAGLGSVRLPSALSLTLRREKDAWSTQAEQIQQQTALPIQATNFRVRQQRPEVASSKEVEELHNLFQPQLGLSLIHI